MMRVGRGGNKLGLLYSRAPHGRLSPPTRSVLIRQRAAVVGGRNAPHPDAGRWHALAQQNKDTVLGECLLAWPSFGHLTVAAAATTSKDHVTA